MLLLLIKKKIIYQININLSYYPETTIYEKSKKSNEEYNFYKNQFLKMTASS
jgi:hypothetical protein